MLNTLQQLMTSFLCLIVAAHYEVKRSRALSRIAHTQRLALAPLRLPRQVTHRVW